MDIKEEIKELEGLIFDAKYYAKEWEDKLYKYQNELEKLKEKVNHPILSDVA